MRFRDRKSCVLSQKMHDLCQNFVTKVVSFKGFLVPPRAISCFCRILSQEAFTIIKVHLVYERWPWWSNNIVVCRDWVRRKKWKYEKAPILSCSPCSSVVAGKWRKSVPSLLLSGGLKPPSTTATSTTTKVTRSSSSLALSRRAKAGPTSPAITRAGAGLVLAR